MKGEGDNEKKQRIRLNTEALFSDTGLELQGIIAENKVVKQFESW